MTFEWESLLGPLYLPQQLVTSSLPAETPTLLPRLATLIGNLHHVYRSNHSTFTYYDNKLDFSNFSAPYDFVNISASYILDVNSAKATKTKSSSYYYYYSGNLMQDELSPLRQFLDSGSWVRKLVKDRPITALLWLGGEGVRASAHYDAVYNVYVHLAGRKRMRLLAPRYTPELVFFGRYHPHACQSRYADLETRMMISGSYRCVSNGSNVEDISSSQSDTEDFPAAVRGQEKAFEVQEFTLRSGDVLFIPPFWTHETVAETASVSMSLWWDAKVLDIMDDIYGLPLPFEDNWSDQIKQSAMVEFAKSLVQSVITAAHSTGDGNSTCEAAASHDETVAAPRESGSILTLTVDNVAHLIRMRYPADWTGPTTTNQICRNDDDGDNREVEDVSKDADDTSNRWRDKVAGRHATFVTTFLRFLSDSNRGANSESKTSDSACVESSARDGTQEDRQMVLAIKLLDFIEDVFRHMLPRAHPAQALVSLGHCLLYHQERTVIK